MFNIPFYINYPRLTYAVLWASWLVCVLVASDSFLVPGKITKEHVLELQRGRNGLHSNSGTVYSVTTDRSWILIPEMLYWKINPYEVVEVERSSITGAQRNLIVHEGEYVYTYGLNYVKDGFGQILLPAILIAGSVLTYFFKRIDSVQGRSNLCVALLITSGYLVFQYLDFLFLFN